MNKNRFSVGFSLPEIIVGSFILSVVALMIVSVLRSYTKIVHKSDIMTTAAILAEDIASKIKDQDFDSVFAYDSKKPSGPPPTGKLCCGASFDPANYLIPLAQSKMQGVLKDSLKRVKAAGFDQFMIGVVFLRRDASDNDGDKRSDEFVAWSNKIKSTNCDDSDIKACFNDYNNDGDYWDKDDVKGLETPQTGLKMISVNILKAGESLGVKHGTVLSKGGLSGEAIKTATSEMKHLISFPINGKYIYHLTNDTSKALELRTFRTYSDAFFDKDTGVSPSSVRIDNTNSAVQLNRTHDIFGVKVSEGLKVPADERLLRVKGQTDKGQGGYLEVYDKYGGLADPNGDYHDRARFAPIGTIFEIWKPDGGRDFKTVSGTNFLMRDGVHTLFSRKTSIQGNDASPYDKRTLFVDNGVPRLVAQSIPNNASWGFGGLTPTHFITVSDYFQVAGNTESTGRTGIHTGQDGPTSVVMNNSLYSYPGRTGDYGMAVGIITATTVTFRLTDKEGYPWQLDHDVVYHTTWEWGDNVGYKNSLNYVFSIPDPSSDVTPPEITVPTVLPPGFAANVMLRSASAAPWEVKQNTDVSFRGALFSDPESGINFKKVKIEICGPDNANPPDMIFNGNTPGCRTILHDDQEHIRPNYPVAEDKFLRPGDYFFYDEATQFRTNCVLVNFKNNVVSGVLAGMNFTENSVWILRVSVENWAGQRSIPMDNNYWKIKIVP